MINTVTKIYEEGIESNCLLVVLTDSTLVVPKDEGNRHYQEVLQWVAEGNEIGEPE